MSNKLGYFLTKSGERQAAENVFVLSVSYPLAKEKWDSSISKLDLEKLRLTFETKRNCKYVEMVCPPIKDVLHLLADETRLMALFNSAGKAPDLLLLFILTHGADDGILFYDEKNAFTTKDVFESLTKLNCLKIVFFKACRTSVTLDQNPAKDCRNACRITYSPKMLDLVVFYATVESYLALGFGRRGSVFIQKICSVFNAVSHDESLISVLTQVQNQVQIFKNNETIVPVDDTPEIKLFSLTRNFIISGLCENQIPSLGRYEGFYPWKSEKGPRRSRRAVILHNNNLGDLQKISDGLKCNLSFKCETVNMLGMDQCDQFKVLRKPAEEVGCIMLVLHGPLQEDPASKEVCIKWKKRVAVTDVLVRFMGPELEGVPKILIVINQNDNRNLEVNKAHKLRLGATDFSGWLVLVLHDQESVSGLARILHGNKIKSGCLQDELVQLLIGENTKPNFMNSTLQYKLRFPTSFFVEPDFKILDCYWKPIKCSVSFRELLALVKKKIKPTVVMLVGEAGSGKTIAMEELANALEGLGQNVLRIQLANEKREIFHKNMDVADFLECTAPSYSKDQVRDYSWENSNVFIDGFSALDNDEQALVLKYVKTLRDEKNLNVWISMRIYEARKDRVFYLNEGSFCVVRMKPFDERKQDQLVRLVSGDEKSFADLQSRVKEYGKEFLQNPLHLRVAVELGDDANLFDHLIKWHKMLSLLKYCKSQLEHRSSRYTRLISEIKREAWGHMKRKSINRIILYHLGVMDFERPKLSVKSIHQNICYHLIRMSDECCIDYFWNQ